MPGPGEFNDQKFNEIITNCLSFEDGTYQSAPARRVYVAQFHVYGGQSQGDQDAHAKINLGTGAITDVSIAPGAYNFNFLNGFTFPDNIDIMVYSGWHTIETPIFAVTPFHRKIFNPVERRLAGGPWPVNVFAGTPSTLREFEIRYTLTGTLSTHGKNNQASWLFIGMAPIQEKVAY